MSRRRRILAFSALFAFVAGIAVAPLLASPAFADDGLELLSPSGTASYGGAEYTFSGTADPSDATAIVIRDGVAPSDPVLCTTPAAANWSCDGDWVPTAGAHTLTAWQDTRHDTVTFTLTVPSPIVDDLTITIIEGGTIHVSGTTTAPNSDIVITIDGSDYCGGGSPYPDGFSWWCDLGGWMGTGTFPLSVRQVVDGVDSATVGGGTLTVLTPGFHLISPVNGNPLVWIVDPTFTSAGLTDDLVTPIDVSIDGTVPGVCDNILPASDGSWSCSVSYPRPNEPATHTVIATQGASSVSASFDVIYPRPDWIGGSAKTAAEGATVTTFSGNAGYDDGGPINELIHVSIFGTGLSCNSSISVVYTWSCDIDTSSLVEDSYNVEVSETYGAISGEILNGTLDVLAAGTTDPVTLTSPVGGATVTGSALFTGTGPVGDGVDVLAQRTGTAIPAQTFCSTTVASDGSWSCSAPATAWGLWDVQAQATDVFSGVTTTPVQALTIAGYPKPTLSYGDPANGIYADGISSNGGDMSIWLYQIDTSNPTQYSWVGPVDNCPLAVPIETGCTLQGGAPLAPGIWNVYAEDVWMDVPSPGESVTSTRDVYFYVPATPVLSPTLNADRTISFAVTREAGSTVTITDVATSAVACTVSGPGTGGTCSTTPTAGSHQYSARAASVGFSSNTGTPRVADNDYDWFSAAVTSAPIVVPVAPPAPAPSPAPTPTPAAAPWIWSFSSDGDGVYFPGDHVSFTGSGVPAGSQILFELHSKVHSLGTAIAASDGTFSFATVIPADVEPGAHHFVLTATPPGAAPSVLEQALEIQLPLVEATADEEPEPEPETEPAASGSEGGGSGGSSGFRGDPVAPSVLTQSIATLSRIVDEPFALALSAALAIALLFLVAVPTELLNSTLSANAGRLGPVFVAVDRRLERMKAWFIRVTRSRALASAILVTVLSVIYGFTDPAFGFDLVSVRLVLALAIGMFVLTYVIGWVTGLLSRLLWGVHSQVELQPSIAIFAVVGVIAARLLDFSPGFFVGVVIGLELLQASQRVAARAALLQFSLVVAVGIGAWLGYSALVAGGPPTDFGGALLGDTLVALTAEGLTAAAIAILPLRFLEGRELYLESKRIWLVAYLIITFAFALLVLPTAMEGTEVGDIGVWVLVFAGFAAVTFGVWFAYASLERRREAAEKRNTAQHDKARG